MTKAFVTGINGQDGSYLAELLLSKDYEVHGLVRRSELGLAALRNIKHLIDDPAIYRKKLFLHAGDMADGTSLHRIIHEVMPDEVYNLAAQADVQESFLMPEYTIDINGIGVQRLIEIVRTVIPKAKFYQASTSELFGDAPPTQNEATPLNPQSPYGIGKYVGFQTVKKYREMYGMFACNGILFNHESPRRGDDYLTRKVTLAVARILAGKQKEIRLGNLEAKRDWGFAKEYVKAMWLMLQYPKADDYCVATGETHTVKEWVFDCFELAGLDPLKYIVIDDKYLRPAEVNHLEGDPYKIGVVLGWEAKTKYKDLLKIMLEADCKKYGVSLPGS